MQRTALTRLSARLGHVSCLPSTWHTLAIGVCLTRKRDLCFPFRPTMGAPALILSCRPNSSASITSSSSATASSSCSSISLGRGNFFAFFALPVQPDLDTSVLQKRYHDLQRQVHPDQENVQKRNTAAAAAEEEEEETAEVESKVTLPSVGNIAKHSVLKSSENVTDDAMQHGSDEQSCAAVSSYANSAYETLRSPYRRCYYLMQLMQAREDKAGQPLTREEEEELLVDDDHRSMVSRQKRRAQNGSSGTDRGGGTDNNTLSEEFLSELLAINEIIFCSDVNDACVRNQLQVLHADLKERNEDYYDRAKETWCEGDMAQFRQVVMKWTYIHNALHHLRQRL